MYHIIVAAAETTTGSAVHVQTIVAILASLVVILGALLTVGRRIYKAIVDGVSRQIEGLAETVNAELKTNGGGSMKDRSNQTVEHAAEARTLALENNRLMREHLIWADVQAEALRDQGLKVPHSPTWREFKAAAQ